jgi:hypothetical protein
MSVAVDQHLGVEVDLTPTITDKLSAFCGMNRTLPNYAIRTGPTGLVPVKRRTELAPPHSSALTL